MSTNSPNISLWMRFKNLTRVQQITVVFLMILVPLIVIAVYRPLGIFFSNQHSYYINGMEDAGVEYLKNDPIASSRVTHVMFARLIYVLQSVNWLAGGSQFLTTLLYFVFGFALIIINLAIAKNWRSYPRFDEKRNIWLLAIMSAVLFVVMLRRISLFDIHMSLAGFYLLSNYLQASSFAVFTLLGIGFLALHRWRIATAILLFGGVMHSVYLILAGPLMLILVYEMYRENKLREGLILFAIFAVIAIPLFILGPLQWAQAVSPETLDFRDHIRAPHHYLVSYWWNQEELMRVVIMALATILAVWKLPSVFRYVMLLFFAYIVLGIFGAYVWENSIIAALVPWRASTFLLPLSQMIIITTVMIILFDLIPERFHTALLLILAILSTVYWISLEPWVWQSAYYDYTSPEIEMVKANTEVDDIIMIPPQMDENFRVYAQRATFVDWKTLGYYLDDWYARIQIAEEMMIATYEHQLEICADADYPLDYYLLPVDAPSANDVTAIASSDDYLLVACPSTS